MAQMISREESIKAVIGFVALHPDRYSAELVQKLQSDKERQAGLNAVLLEACKLGDVFATALALKAGAAVNSTECLSRTPAHGARLDCLKLLIEHRQESFKALIGLLTLQPDKYSAKLVDKLLSDVQRQLRLNEVLRTASKVGEVFAVELALGSGAQVNAKDYDGNTPAHWAAASAHLDCLKFLIEHGANLNAKNAGGSTPGDIGKINARSAIINYIDDWRAAHPESKH